MISNDVYLTEEERVRLEQFEKDLDIFEERVMASGLTPTEYLKSQGYMTDVEDEWHKELVARSVPIG